MTRALVPSRLPKLIRSSRSYGLVRRAGFKTSVTQCAAHEFSMPALSPTMTEGNIAAWKVQEGDTFTAGDVLLEIETDKAQMEVEAQDDGIMAKIVHPAGAKGIKVGTRIAVTADPDDELATLDLSSADSSKPTSSPEQQPSGKKPENKSEIASPPPEVKQDAGTRASSAISQTARNENYPLFPSVIQLLHERGISQEESNQISATGPNGRLLKGDVLAYLGDIQSSYAKDQSERIKKLGHLDLSNIEVAQAAAPKSTEAKESTSGQPRHAAPPVREVALPISLAAVQAVRERIQRVLGVEMSIETFIARATQICNEDLPQSKSRKPSADELFNAVLGLDKVSTRSPGPLLVPQLQAFASGARSRPAAGRKVDILDELTGRAPAQRARRPIASTRTEVDPSIELFSVSVPAGDEKRARVFLERLKTVLQVEPGKLVL